MKNGWIIALWICLSMLIVPFAAAGQGSASERFTMIGDNIVLDNKTGYMWASSDNGSDIDWDKAKAYCDDFEAGGYTDWRLPNLEHLESLWDPEQKKHGKYGITPLITLTDCCMWSSEYNLNSAAIVSFKTGRQPWGFTHDSYQLRALPVRIPVSIRTEGSNFDRDVAKQSGKQ